MSCLVYRCAALTGKEMAHFKEARSNAEQLLPSLQGTTKSSRSTSKPSISYYTLKNLL